jgi:hypothetical protein
MSLFQLAGHACHGFSVTNFNHFNFLIRSLALLHTGSVITSIDFKTHSGDITNVHLSEFHEL